MQLNNSTDIDNEKIRELISFSKPANVANFDVMIKNLQRGKGARGRAYSRGSSYHYSRRPFLVVAIQKSENNYPMKTYNEGAYLPFTVRDRIENLLYVLAHELRHLWQGKIKKGWRVWGAKGQFSERDADAYAIRKIREYRRKNGSYTDWGF